MKKYIDVEEAEKVFKQMEENDVELYGVHISECFDADRAIDALKEIPAADVKEVKHGFYVGEYDGYADGAPVYVMWYCSECECRFEDWDEEPTYNYCPNCGARMDFLKLNEGADIYDPV